MRNALAGILVALPIAFAASHASALPGHAQAPAFKDSPYLSDLIEVKGGHGRGGHGWGRGHGRAWGASRGRKVGWRGRGCPPGLWRQGRC